MSFTYTETFTLAHAKELSAKVVADLYQCSLLYDRPAAVGIASYRDELTVLLSRGFVEAYEFGFTENGRRLLTWQYSVTTSGALAGGSSASGGLYSKGSVARAGYFNFLTFSRKWFDLTADEQTKIEQMLPFVRTPGVLPVDGNGYWTTERTYAAGGVIVQRRNYRPL